MMTIMTTSGTRRQSRGITGTAQEGNVNIIGGGGLIDGKRDNSVETDPSNATVSTFWSAVASGGLIQGRPIEEVSAEAVGPQLQW